MECAASPLHEEQQYISLIKRIMEKGILKRNRTGTDTYGIIGHTMRFSLVNGTVPLLTTKRMFWKGIVLELLFFLRGETDAKQLSAQGVKIWDLNTADTNGCIGPMYGWQWRHFGAVWRGPDHCYKGEGVDQLAEVIRDLWEEPLKRDIIMTALNPVDKKKGVLSPCHVMVHFCAEPRKDSKEYDLTACVTQRSADVGLGVPFNIASYALLTHIIAKATGMHAKELVYTTEDTHIYSNHMIGIAKHCERNPFPFPRVDLSGWEVDAGDVLKSVTSLRYEQIKLLDYKHHDKIDFEQS